MEPFSWEKFKTFGFLTQLDLAYNNLSVEVSSIRLNQASCNLHKFLDLAMHNELLFLDLSNSKITGVRTLSCNSIVDLQKPYNIPGELLLLDLHSNKLQGNLPMPPTFAIYVDYSSNNFQESIPVDIGNFISFTGDIPPCLVQNIETLGVLDLGRNNFTGEIPDSFSGNCGLKTLDLSRNNIEGKIPTSLANCKFSLYVLNLSHNSRNNWKFETSRIVRPFNEQVNRGDSRTAYKSHILLGLESFLQQTSWNDPNWFSISNIFFRKLCGFPL
ncbi:hypothetical protein ACJIZ3_000997 [Penstemon smallii]|uniref:Uncharacterized protein n=1 Tax=Penstemon smallii TaxID=265156 RepID=A0ABD3U2B7_9LAMI